MSRLFRNEIVAVTLDQQGNPIAFRWKRAHTVERVHQRWHVDTEWWSEAGRANRKYFAVTTDDGMACVFYRDLIDEQWYIERVYD